MMSVIPITIEALTLVPNGLNKGLNDMEIRIEAIQTRALLR